MSLETEQDWRQDKTATYTEGDWYDDPDEVVAFIRWYYDGTPKALVSEVCDMFERPWEWNAAWSGYQKETSKPAS